MENKEHKGELTHWEKIKGLFMKLYGNVWVSREVLEKYGQLVSFGIVDQMDMWKYLEEAVIWEELEISEDGKIFKMTEKGRERWKKFSEGS